MKAKDLKKAISSIPDNKKLDSKTIDSLVNRASQISDISSGKKLFYFQTLVVVAAKNIKEAPAEFEKYIGIKISDKNDYLVNFCYDQIPNQLNDDDICYNREEDEDILFSLANMAGAKIYGADGLTVSDFIDIDMSDCE